MTYSTIRELLKDRTTLDETINFLKAKHKLLITEETISGKRLIHVTRPIPSNKYDMVQDEASVVVIDENLKIISKGIEKIYDIDNEYCSLDLRLKKNGVDTTYEELVVVEEWLPGTVVVISKYSGELVISTENSIMNIGQEKLEYKNAVLKALDEVLECSETSVLFNASILEHMSWVFNLIQKKNRFELILIGAINLNNLTELSIIQLNNLSEHFKFSRPRRKIARTRAQIDEIATEFTKTPGLRGVIISDGHGHRGKIRMRERLHKVNLERIAYCVMTNKTNELDSLRPKYDKMISLVTTQFNKYLVKLNDSYTQFSGIRVRKVFASKIKYQTLASVLFAIRDDKISDVTQLYKVVKPRYLLKLIKVANEKRFNDAL